MTEFGMQKDEDLQLAVNRLKSLQKLYLFEQKGGENYLSDQSADGDSGITIDTGKA